MCSKNSFITSTTELSFSFFFVGCLLIGAKHHLKKSRSTLRLSLFLTMLSRSVPRQRPMPKNWRRQKERHWTTKIVKTRCSPSTRLSTTRRSLLKRGHLEPRTYHNFLHIFLFREYKLFLYRYRCAQGFCQ